MAKATLKKELGKLGKNAMGYVKTLIYVVLIVVIIIIVLMLALHAVKAVLFEQGYTLNNAGRVKKGLSTRDRQSFLNALKIDPKILYKDETTTVINDIQVLMRHNKVSRAFLAR